MKNMVIANMKIRVVAKGDLPVDTIGGMNKDFEKFLEKYGCQGKFSIHGWVNYQ
jgi:hypothetical protein